MKAFLLIFILAIFSCSVPKPPARWKNQKVIPDNEVVAWNMGSDDNEKIRIMYNGSGSVAFDIDGELLLTDPYFSNNSFLSILFGKIKTSPSEVEYGLKKLDEAAMSTSKVKHILIGHSHYDHLMDLPYLYFNRKLNEAVKVYGSSSSFNAVKKFIPDTIFNIVEDASYDPFRALSKSYKWLYLSDKIRILPILADHAPHFWKIRLMEGQISEKGIRNFAMPTSKTYAPDWKNGNVFSYLIDYMISGEVKFRLFYQSSSCETPYGFPPEEELKNKQVDIALVGVASSQNTKTYPHTLLQKVNPEKVILIHWEDFFSPLNKPVKTVPFTNFNNFFKRIRKSYNVKELKELHDKVVMPVPGTLFKITI